MTRFLPQARADGLLIEELEDELLVYDQNDDTAHRLNRTAALVWRNCDGTRDVEALVALLRTELDVADEDLVRIALDDLLERGLVTGAPERPLQERRMSRRRFIRRVGTVGAAALALPVVVSIAAPDPAAAQSPCSFCECGDGTCACGTCICSCTSCAGAGV